MNSKRRANFVRSPKSGCFGMAHPFNTGRRQQGRQFFAGLRQHVAERAIKYLESGDFILPAWFAVALPIAGVPARHWIFAALDTGKTAMHPAYGRPSRHFGFSSHADGTVPPLA
ncbi:hypothetical protein LWE61_12365 [Sphingobium sufflavum]|uniref:hypothetical protein n=1 Tax=Sphingobium sufflavum TaxID=1129547 RepID=UPI001F259E7B|nr:hypothetical protein [Sphingobium sufflavum]MCE7797349.1 hypothetical protein [Sphingobium sufflavum]